MQVIPDGPDIPERVLRAQDEGKLAVFCGAGISIPNGLPGFESLVDRVVAGLGQALQGLEQSEYDRKNYDRVFGLLEGPGRFSASQVRRQVRDILEKPADKNAGPHRAILDLSTDRGGHLHLVTTNFDRLFEEAEPTADVQAAAAPMLPVPKPGKWDHLVYLHGRLGDDDPDGARLVLTSADFGVAYLVERWASRFVSELFSNFHVLFVGYAVDDPVMRYLVDAIAAERQRGLPLQGASAFAPFPFGEGERVEQLWNAKGIRPILYDKRNGHELLHGTLAAWAGIWKGGLGSKLNIIDTLGIRVPGTLPPDEVSRLCWAVKDPSGAIAERFAKLGKEAPITWLEEFEQEGVLTNKGSEQGARPALVDNGSGAKAPGDLDPVQSGLARWLSCHLDKPGLVEWVIGKGSQVHPRFAFCVRQRLAQSGEVPEPFRRFWGALTGGVTLAFGQDAYNRLFLHNRVQSAPWTPAFRNEILSALAPCLTLKKASFPSTPVPASKVSDLVSVRCDTHAGSGLDLLLTALRRRADGPQVLADLAYDATGLLRLALDMMASLDGVSSDWDRTLLSRLSLEPHPQNSDFEPWSPLIDLVRESFERLVDEDAEAARGLVRLWARIPYPVFRRLVLHGLRRIGM